MPADCLILIAAILATQLPMPRLPKPLARLRARRLKHARIAHRDSGIALAKQAEFDTLLARVYARAEYEMRMATINNWALQSEGVS